MFLGKKRIFVSYVDCCIPVGRRIFSVKVSRLQQSKLFIGFRFFTFHTEFLYFTVIAFLL